MMHINAVLNDADLSPEAIRHKQELTVLAGDLIDAHARLARARRDLQERDRALQVKLAEVRGDKVVRTDTPHGPVWLVPDKLPEKVAKQVARVDLAWPDLEGFDAGHTGRGPSGAWLVRAPLAALEARGLPTGSAAEHPVEDGTVWPPVHLVSSEPAS